MTGPLARTASIVFVPRHGGDHSIPPSAINYRANVAAMRDLGAMAASWA